MPGYFVLLNGWLTVAGEEDFALRYLSVWPSVAAVALIYRSRFIYVPVSTVTAGDDGRLTTSLTRNELRDLR